MNDRRNDIGNKVFVGVILFMLGFFVNTLWAEVSKVKDTASLNQAEIVGLRANYESIKADLVEIKQLLSRRIPI